MKTTITRTALATLVLLLSLTFSSYAQSTFPHLYLCDNATATLHPEEPVTPLVNGDKVHWFLDGVAIAGNPKVYDGTAASIDLVVPASLAVGLHKYTTAVETLAGCLGVPSDPFDVYKLPTKDLALTENRATYCAEDSNPLSGAIITATTTPAASIPAGIEYIYTWSATKNGIAFTPLSDLGASDGSKSNVNIFTMSIKDAGTYVFSAKVKYELNAAAVAFGSILKSGDNNGCEVSQTATQTITVTPKPGKPRIVLGS